MNYPPPARLVGFLPPLPYLHLCLNFPIAKQSFTAEPMARSCSAVIGSSDLNPAVKLNASVDVFTDALPGRQYFSEELDCSRIS
jgi:hypothetical protein